MSGERRASRFTLSNEAHESIRLLSDLWQVSMSSAVDRAVKEAAEREVVGVKMANEPFGMAPIQALPSHEAVRKCPSMYVSGNQNHLIAQVIKDLGLPRDVTFIAPYVIEVNVSLQGEPEKFLIPEFTTLLCPGPCSPFVLASLSKSLEVRVTVGNHVWWSAKWVDGVLQPDAVVACIGEPKELWFRATLDPQFFYTLWSKEAILGG